MNGTPRPPNVLILDEPTNHLDLESREALEDALRSFEGALLLVSHDRALLDAVGTRTVAIEDRSLRSFLGGWPEYVRVREERRAAGGSGDGTARPPVAVIPPDTGTRPETGNGVANGGKAAKAKNDGPSKNRVRDQAKAEQAVEQAEAAMRALEDELADPAAWATKYEAAKSEARHTAARRAVEETYARLEALVD
jgi:ATP-binding cassette subfamily F protein 3